MRLADLPTPCLVLDRAILERNIAAMANGLARHGVPLRPHMKTAKSIDVARLATAGQPGGITVSTLAEAEYFAGHGIAGDTTGNSPSSKWVAWNAIAEQLDYGRRYTARTNQVQRSFEDTSLKQRALELVSAA